MAQQRPAAPHSQPLLVSTSSVYPNPIQQPYQGLSGSRDSLDGSNRAPLGYLSPSVRSNSRDSLDGIDGGYGGVGGYTGGLRGAGGSDYSGYSSGGSLSNSPAG